MPRRARVSKAAASFKSRYRTCLGFNIEPTSQRFAPSHSDERLRIISTWPSTALLPFGKGFLCDAPKVTVEETAGACGEESRKVGMNV
jgi:hypothetical protein